LAQLAFQPIEQGQDELESALGRMDVAFAQPNVHQIPRLAEDRYQRMIATHA